MSIRCKVCVYVSFTAVYMFMLGISGHSQFLYAVFFTTKFIDLLAASLFLDIVLKIVFLAAAYVAIYFVFVRFVSTYDSSDDIFRAEMIIIFLGGISMLINHQFTFKEVCACVHVHVFIDFLFCFVLFCLFVKCLLLNATLQVYTSVP